MPSSGTEVAVRVFDAIKAWDVAAVLALMDPHVELDLSTWLLDGKRYHGHGGIRAYLEEIASLWGRPWFEVDRLVETGDRVVAVGHTHGTNPQGIHVEAPSAWLLAFSAGRIARVRVYGSEADALAAAERDAAEVARGPVDRIGIVRATYDAWSRGDIEAMTADYHPEIVLHDAPEMPDAGVYEGLDAVRRRLAWIMEATAGSKYEIERTVEVGDRVVTIARLHGGPVGAPPYDMRTGQVVHFRGPRIVSIRVYLDPERALREAGAREPA